MSRSLFPITSRPAKPLSVDLYDNDIEEKIRVAEELISHLRTQQKKNSLRSDVNTVQLENGRAHV